MTLYPSALLGSVGESFLLQPFWGASNTFMTSVRMPLSGCVTTVPCCHRLIHRGPLANGYSGSSSLHVQEMSLRNPLICLFQPKSMYNKGYLRPEENLALKPQFRENIELARYTLWALATSLQPQAAWPEYQRVLLYYWWYKVWKFWFLHLSVGVGPHSLTCLGQWLCRSGNHTWEPLL